MSIASEITRLQTAKSTLKTKLNAKNDAQHQITNETIDDYGAFVDSISADLSEYYTTSLSNGTAAAPGIAYSIKAAPSNFTCGNNLSYAFTNCTNLTTGPSLSTSNVTNMSNMFESCSNLTEIPLLDTSSVTNMSYMFSSCSKLETVPQLNTSNVTNMTFMFALCNSKLKQVPLFNTSKVTNMSYMFTNCTSLETVPQFDASKVTNFTNMFDGCTRLSNNSLNNIMAMCVGATSYTGTKTLKRLGLSSSNATICTGLSNYSAFTSAGWTTGY